MTLNEYLRYGGYPGSYKFIEDQPRWRNYLINSIIDSVINKDILSNAVVKKPALFRQLFNILSSYPSQEISYRKLLGQMQDKGNAEVIKYYISLYEGAFLFKGIPKFSNQAHKVKTSSPKVIPLAPCFYNIAEDSDEKLSWVFESIVGADLIKKHNQVYYWRDGNYEVDFVYKEQGTIFAVEVKSGRKKNPRGLEAFLKKFPSAETKFISQDSFRC